MWLIGMMGSGKTTVGRKVASAVGARFYDTDQMVIEVARVSISAIWDDVGEKGFRELERRAIASVPASGFIAAAGGGAVLDETNRDHMKRDGPVVWLRCDPETLAARLTADGEERPLLEGDLDPADRLAGILEQRADMYSDLATDVVDTARHDVSEVVSEVVAIWER